MSRPSPIYNGTCKKFSFASSATKQGVKTYVEECMTRRDITLRVATQSSSSMMRCCSYPGDTVLYSRNLPPATSTSTACPWPAYCTVPLAYR